MMLRDVMSGDVLTTTSGATVTDAARAMTEREVGSAVVVTDDGELEGIITERDVLRAVAAGRDLGGEVVADWMTSDPITVEADDPPSEVVALMRERGFRHLPVLEQGDLAGIVSMRDLWKFSFLPPEPDGMMMD
jgi:CBS domain-containing protein